MRSYTQIYIMSVFGVKYRLGLIDPKWEKQLHSVIANSLKQLDGVMPIEVGGFHDHIHMLYSSQGKVSEAEILKYVKKDSSRWVNRNRLTVGRFGWQDECGSFSYSKSQVKQVKQYIRNQPIHHANVSFRDEYAHCLKSYRGEFDESELPENLI